MTAKTVNISSKEVGQLEESTVEIFRCSKVVRGGRRFSFGALVVVGDQNGTVGVGYGKANEVPMAVEKGIKDAKKSLYKINLVGKTIPHKVDGRASSTKVALVPASPGTGVIAGSCARAVLDAAGVHDVLTKVFGSTSAKNVVKATLNGLLQLKSKEQIEEIRGVKVEAVNK